MKNEKIQKAFLIDPSLKHLLEQSFTADLNLSKAMSIPRATLEAIAESNPNALTRQHLNPIKKYLMARAGSHSPFDEIKQRVLASIGDKLNTQSKRFLLHQMYLDDSLIEQMFKSSRLLSLDFEGVEARDWLKKSLNRFELLMPICQGTNNIAG